MTASDLRVIIIGSGFAGIGAAIRLRQRGVRDITILERADAIGGTWRDNTYPGAACDIPSHLYSLSFEPKPDWSRRYAPQPEIRAYLESCVDRHRLRPHVRLGRTVVSGRFDDVTGTWTVRTDRGERFTAEVLVSAIGALRDPAYPPIPGRECFAGPQMHTARWDHDVELEGRRVAVVGTGASAIQVVPALAGRARHLTVLQRTPAWIMPRRDRAYTRLEKALFRRSSPLRRLHRAWIHARLEGRLVFFGRSVRLNRLAQRRALAHLRSQVPDRELRRRLVPDHRVGCKRILVSDDFYPALVRDDVTLETAPIARVEPDGIVTADGRHIPLDAIVWATGFTVDDPLGPLDLIGRGGVSLQERWADRPSAYLGISVPDFPNLLLLLGPNTGLGHNSIIHMIESQIDHLVAAVDRLREPEVAALDVRPERLTSFVDEVDARHEGLVWASGCHSWYLDDRGRNFTLWPGSTVGYRRRAAAFDAHDYRELRHAEPEPAPVRPASHTPGPAA
jgi:cation diffusion facilitator CzcD-associated flavoprotein CzcO